MTEENEQYEKTILYDDGRVYEIIIDKKTNIIIEMRPIN